MRKRNHKSVRKISESKPLEVFASNGSFEGEVNLQWDAVKKANHYIIQISKSSNTWRQIDIVSNPHYSINGLKSGKVYGFRISALYQSGQGPWSSPVMKKVK